MVRTTSTSFPPFIPSTEWPLTIKALALLARAADQRIGDVIARAHRAGGWDAYKASYHEKFGQSCGCSERQTDLNAKYPLAGQMQ
jgi:hypothetical protein